MKTYKEGLRPKLLIGYKDTARFLVRPPRAFPVEVIQSFLSVVMEKNGPRHLLKKSARQILLKAIAIGERDGVQLEYENN